MKPEGCRSQTMCAEDVAQLHKSRGRAWAGGVLVALLTFVAFGCATGQRAGKATQGPVHKIFLWQATHYQNPKSALAIYGVLPASLRGHSGHDLAVKQAFQKADAMALEFGYSTPQQERMATIYTQRFGVMPPGTRLYERLSRVTLKRYLKACQALGISPRMFVRHRPWLAGLAMQQLHMELLRYRHDRDKEPNFNTIGRIAKKQLHLLSNFKQGILPFAELPSKGQDAMVLQASLSVLTWRHSALRSKLHAAYRRGDLSAVDRLLFSAVERYPKHIIALRNLQKSRNIRIVLSLKKAFNAKDQALFFPVEMGLLFGQMGLLQLLKNEGFSLKRLPGTGQLTSILPGTSPRPLAKPTLSKVPTHKATASPKPRGLSTRGWFFFQDRSYGFSARMTTKPKYSDRIIPTGAGNAAIRSYSNWNWGFQCYVVGYRYPVHVTMLLRQPKQRARIIRKVLTDYLRKHGGKILKEINGAYYAGRNATYLRIRTRSSTSEGYLFYFQGQIFWIFAEYVGRIGKGDYRHKLAKAFFRSFRILPFTRK